MTRSVGRRGAVMAAAGLVGAILTACSSGAHRPAEPSSDRPAVTTVSSAGGAATRWWSDAAAAQGSTVDPAHPGAAAVALHPSRKDYCAVLAATVRAGRQLLGSGTPGAGAAVAQAFVAEVQRLAPPEVALSWQVLGPAVLRVSRASDVSSATSATGDSSAIRTAVVTIARDAKARCGVNLAG